MARNKAEKRVLKDQFAEEFSKANAAIIAEYRGLKVSELTELRVKLREANASFKVIKNRVAKFALREHTPKLAALADQLKGPVGLVLVFGEPAPVAKALLEWGKDKENFKLKNGVLDGTILKSADIKELSDMPSREAMLGQIAGLIQTPAQNILNLAVAIPRQLAQVIFALSEKKQA